MQKIIRFALSLLGGLTLLATAPAQAQTFANSDLENWAMRNSTQAPVDWLTTDDVFSAVIGTPLPFTLGTVSRTADRQSGSYAAKLETVSNPFLGDTLPGLLVLGNRFSTQGGLPGGMPFTARPASLQFYYKLTGANAANDSAQVVVALTRNVNGSQTPIAGAQRLLLTPTSTYTLVTLPLVYTPATFSPDSVHIIITSGGADMPTPGTALYIDNLRFTGTSAARDAKLDAALSVYPNPSTGRFTLNSTEPALLAAPLTVMDATGRCVLRAEAARPAATRALDLSGQPGGIYTLQLQTAEGIVTRKLVVQ